MDGVSLVSFAVAHWPFVFLPHPRFQETKDVPCSRAMEE